jgi:hypothetical protein
MSQEAGTEGTTDTGSLNKRKIRRWTEAEHATLLRLVTEMGDETCWAAIAEQLPGRTGKQCRERWVNHIGCG